MRSRRPVPHPDGVTTTTPPAPPAGSPMVPARAVTPRQLEWLSGEVARWRASGLVDAATAERVLAHYTAHRRGSLSRLLLVVGACFVGTGLVWLVAANLDRLSPTLRLVGVTAVWLVLLLGPEAGRRRLPAPVAAAGHLLAVLAFGAVVFQAAQSLQVPAWEPDLLGVWAGGALLQAYAVRSALAVVVGVGTGTAWLLWAGLAETGSGLGLVVLLGAASVAALAVGALHDRAGVDLGPLGAPWREGGAALALAALFAAALPFVDPAGAEPGAWSLGALAVAGLLAAAVVALVPGTARLEPLAAVAALGVAVGLVVWEAGTDATDVDAAGWAHAAVGVTAYVGAAVAVAALGVLRDSGRLAVLATVALVAFTTFQAFAVFARIIEGAWLFLLLGVVLAGTGWLFDRARRTLARSLEEQ